MLIHTPALGVCTEVVHIRYGGRGIKWVSLTLRLYSYTYDAILFNVNVQNELVHVWRHVVELLMLILQENVGIAHLNMSGAYLNNPLKASSCKRCLFLDVPFENSVERWT